MSYAIELSPKIENLSADDLQVGDLIVLGDSTLLSGHVVLKTYGGFVSLTNPMIVWGPDAQIKSDSRRVPPGTQVTLTVK